MNNNPYALFMLIFFIIVIVGIVIKCLYISSQQKLANALTDSNQTPRISGAWLWTQLIPLWSIVALIVTMVKLTTESQINQTRNNLDKPIFSATLCYTYLVLGVLSIIPVLGAILGLVSFVIWIVFWVKIVSMRGVVESQVNTQESVGLKISDSIITE